MYTYWNRDGFLLVASRDNLHYARAFIDFGFIHSARIDLCPTWKGCAIEGKRIPEKVPTFRYTYRVC